MSVTDELLAEQRAATPPRSTRATCRCRRPRRSRSSRAWTRGSNPYGVLGLEEGDAHVIRNAGGVVTDDEIRSLAISQRLLGTEEIILIHHTDCGMLTFTDDEFKRQIQDETGIKPAVGRRGVRRPRRGRPPVDRPDQGEPVHPAQGRRARLRLRRRDRPPREVA